jgi:amidase
VIGQRDALAGGTTTARALLDAHLERIAALEPRLGAFRLLREEAARAEADEADRLLGAGERLPLLGVPVAIKDDVDLAGETTPFGCGGRLDPVSDDAPLVSRLREAGAVIVGKTNTPELGQWPFTEGPGFGATRNPYDPERTPGGSSGGAAAAVAAGMVPGAVGSDGAGSVRIPAAWCGLVGIKPTRDLIPGPAEIDFNGLTCYGPLARTVGDAALLLDVLAGAGDTYSAAAASAPPRLRIGLSFSTPWFVPAKVDPEVRAAVLGVADKLRELGHEVIDAEPDHRLAGVLFISRSTAGVRQALEALGPGAEVEKRTRDHARVGAVLGGPLLAGSKRLEPWLASRMGRVYERVDVLLAPTTAKPALRVGQLDGGSYWHTGTAIEAACPFAFPWNVVGWPGVNVPAGLDSGGVPLGAQLLGRRGDDARLVALAAQLEHAGAWGTLRPPI